MYVNFITFHKCISVKRPTVILFITIMSETIYRLTKFIIMTYCHLSIYILTYLSFQEQLLFLSPLKVHCFFLLTVDLCVRVVSMSLMACCTGATNAFSLTLCSSDLRLALHQCLCFFMSSRRLRWRWTGFNYEAVRHSHGGFPLKKSLLRAEWSSFVMEINLSKKPHLAYLTPIF